MKCGEIKEWTNYGSFDLYDYNNNDDNDDNVDGEFDVDFERLGEEELRRWATYNHQVALLALINCNPQCISLSV